MIIVIFILIIISNDASAQIGINTESNLPTKSLFVVDGLKDNPSSGIISPTQQQNDVVFTQDGNLGVGTHNPTAKLHIVRNSSITPGVYPFRLDKGAQANYATEYLSNGTVGWVRQETTLASKEISIPAPTGSGAATNVFYKGASAKNITAPGLPFIAPKESFYSFEIRFWGFITNTAYLLLPKFEVKILLQRNTVGGMVKTVDSFTFTSLFLNSAITSTCTLYGRMKAGDEMNVAIEVLQDGGIGLPVSTNTSYAWTTSKIRVLEMKVAPGKELY